MHNHAIFDMPYLRPLWYLGTGIKDSQSWFRFGNLHLFYKVKKCNKILLCWISANYFLKATWVFSDDCHTNSRIFFFFDQFSRLFRNFHIVYKNFKKYVRILNIQFFCPIFKLFPLRLFKFYGFFFILNDVYDILIHFFNISNIFGDFFNRFFWNF